MEVAVAEEKKKIFRARKTMKISDRQQLESLHSTLLTGAQTLSSSPSPPLLNGRHKEDAQKTSEKEKNDSSDSNSHTTPSLSPASRGSPTALLSLNLSPSPPMSQSPKAKEDNSSSPTSPFYPIDFDLKIMEEEGKSGAPSLPSNGLVEASAEGTEDKYEDEQTAHETVNVEKQKDGQATTGHPAMISLKDSVLHSPTSPMSSVTKTEKERSSPEPGHTDPMEVVSDTTAAETLKSTPAVQTKVEKPSSPKASTSSSLSCPSSSSVPGQDQEVKDEKGQEPGEMNTGNIKEGDKNDCKDKKTTLLPKVVEKMEVDTVKVETKKEKEEAGQPAKPSRPSSTPPAQTERSSISGLKRALSEGSDNDGLKLQQDAKKPKVEGVELEAQLELKITAKASSRLKLEKVVQQLVGERLMDLQITVFDKSLQELKDRVEKIDCATKHQTALNSLQTKIARLVKKFGEANQASENKRKQEAVAASAAAAAATAAAAAAAAATTTTKAVAAPSTLSTQRVLRRQTVEPQPEAPRDKLAPSAGKTPTLTLKKKKKKKKCKESKETKESRDAMEERKCEGEEMESPSGVRPSPSSLAGRLVEYSEGKCRADIKLRSISSHLENRLFNSCQSHSGTPRPDRYASYIFRNLVPYETYCEWVAKVNFVGLLGKDALPRNLRKSLRMYIERRFSDLSCDNWREIRDSINAILRVEKKPEFFGAFKEKIFSSSS